MFVVNKKVATSLFPDMSLKVNVGGGFAYVEQKIYLVPLKVIHSTVSNDYSMGYHEGSTVWVRGENCKHKWAMEVYNIDGKDFILVPEELICLVSEE